MVGLSVVLAKLEDNLGFSEILKVNTATAVNQYNNNGRSDYFCIVVINMLTHFDCIHSNSTLKKI